METIKEIIERRTQELKELLKEKAQPVLHFKGGKYLVLAIVEHTEDGSQMVAYKSIKDDPTHPHYNKFWVRPIEMFLSPVDREKYPDSQYDYRFMFHKDVMNELQELIHDEPVLRDIKFTFEELQEMIDDGQHPTLKVEYKENPRIVKVITAADIEQDGQSVLLSYMNEVGETSFSILLFEELINNYRITEDTMANMGI